MNNKIMVNAFAGELTQKAVGCPSASQKKYEKPELTCFGDVRDITLGGSIPGGESLGNSPEGCIVGFEPGCT